MPDAIDLGSRHLHAGAVDGVLRVVIDRPERRNALTIEMYHGLKKAAVLAERDPAIDELLLFTAAEVSAAEALAMGLVARVVPHAELEAALAETIERIRQTGPQARAALKRDLNRQLPAIDFTMFMASLVSDEVREGFAAFVAKRPPAWTRRKE